jgi:hypothetical protein
LKNQSYFLVVAAAAIAVAVSFLNPPTLLGQSSSPLKSLTIEAIYASGGLTGRGPETIEWSPDSSKLSFIQRDDEGENG